MGLWDNFNVFKSKLYLYFDILYHWKGVVYTNIMTRRTFVSTTILLQMAGCTAVQVSRRHLEVEPLKKKMRNRGFFALSFAARCP